MAQSHIFGINVNDQSEKNSAISARDSFPPKCKNWRIAKGIKILKILKKRET